MYSTNEPQTAFHQRISFCLDIYNQSVKVCTLFFAFIRISASIYCINPMFRFASKGGRPISMKMFVVWAPRSSRFKPRLQPKSQVQTQVPIQVPGSNPVNSCSIEEYFSLFSLVLYLLWFCSVCRFQLQFYFAGNAVSTKSLQQKSGNTGGQLEYFLLKIIFSCWTSNRLVVSC